MNIILCIPADSFGNKLYLKELKEKDNRIYIKYKSTYNDMPFQETELFSADNGKNLIITGEDSTVLYRFSIKWLDKL